MKNLLIILFLLIAISISAQYTAVYNGKQVKAQADNIPGYIIPSSGPSTPDPTPESAYFISNDGSDSNSGTHPDNAWATISKLNGETFFPGDTIVFNKGDMWIEQLTVPSSGSDGAPIVFTSYGTGDNPIITCKSEIPDWDVALDWTEDTGITTDDIAVFHDSNNGALSLNTRNIIPADALAIDGDSIRIEVDPDSNVGTAFTGVFIGEQAASGDEYDMESGTITQVTFNDGDNTLSTRTTSIFSDWIEYDFDKTKVYIISIGTTGGYTTCGFGRGYERYHKSGGQADAGVADVSTYSSGTAFFNFTSIEVSSSVSDRWYRTHSTRTSRLWLDGVAYKSSEDIGSLSETDLWFWDEDSSRLYIHSATNPASTFESMDFPGTLPSAIYINNKSYITFKDIDIRGGYLASIDLIACNDLIVEDCNVGLNTGGYGILGNYGQESLCERGIVRRCTFDTGDSLIYTWGRGYIEHENTVDGIMLRRGCNDWDIYENTFINWKHTGVYIYSSHATYTAARNKVHHNDISAPHIEWGRPLSVDGIADQAMDNEIYSNYIHDCGVRIQLNANGTKFHHNIINGITSSRTSYNSNVSQGLALSGYANTSPHDIEIYNNTIVNCDGAGIEFHDGASQNDKRDNLIKNNLIYNCAIDNTDETQLYMMDGEGVLDNTYTYNLFYKSGVTDLIYYGHDTADDYPHTVTEFNAENGTASDIISNNIGGDPLFTNGSGSYSLASDFQLDTGSPAINAGTDVGLTEDFDGNSIVGLPDIGAYEKQ